MAEQSTEQGRPGEPEAGRKETQSPKTQPAGLIAMIPNQVLPEESKRHLWAARREFLLAMRSLTDAALGRLESLARARRKA